jgi:Rieske Fe-S protein
MNRKEFIVKSCAACIGATALSTLVSSCAATQFANGKLTKDGILVDVNEFALKEKDKYRSYIVVRNESLLFPVCVYHQGAELNVAGEYLQCPAHGSEYSNKGVVTNGPADKNLRTFPVTVNKNQLFIDLRKV